MSKREEEKQGIDEMVTFQPYEEEIKPINASTTQNNAFEAQHAFEKAKTTPKASDAIKGVLLGVLLAALFIAYDLFFH